MRNLSDPSSTQRDGKPGTSPASFFPNHRTTSRTSPSNANVKTPTFWPSPPPFPSSITNSNHGVSDEEYADFLAACNYPGPMREYWEDVAKRTNQRVFECGWEGCAAFILHPPVPVVIPREVVSHLGDHCWRSGHCQWRGCRERKPIPAEDMCRHLMTHI